MSRFVVAGVTGHVGAVAAADLLAAGETVTVIVRDEKKGADWKARGAALAVGSLDDSDFMASALKGADGFFTLIPPGYSAADYSVEQRKGTDGVVDGVKRSGVPLVVLLSSIGADRADKNGPIKGLHRAENLLRETGTKLVALRATYFQENTGGAIAAAKSAGIYPNFFASADAAFPQVATPDIGHEVAKLLQAPPARSEVVDMLGPSYSMRQVAEKLGKAMGKTLPVVDIPVAGQVAALTQAGLPQILAEAFVEMYAGFSAGLLVPKGDRQLQGTTPIDVTITKLLG